MKRPNLRIIGMEDGEEAQILGPENILDKIIEENCLYLKKENSINIQETYRIPTRLYQKRKSPNHIIIKTENSQNKDNVKSCKGERPCNIKRQNYQKYTWLLNRDAKIWKSMDKIW